MIFHLIEILLLLVIICKIYVIDVQPLEWWQTPLILVVIFFLALLDQIFYKTDVDYSKIRQIIREELKK